MTIKERLLNFGVFEVNEYFQKYVDLINTNINRPVEKFITNKHHIIPKCYYIKKNLEIDNSKFNIVNLKYTDHILAHYYLCLFTTDEYLKYSGVNAIKHIMGMKYFPKDEVDIIKQLPYYEELYNTKCKKHSQLMKHKLSGDNNPSKRLDVRQKISVKNKGHIVTQETRDKISKANKGTKRKPYKYTEQGLLNMHKHMLGDLNPSKRPEVRKRNSEAHKGKIRITNGLENKTIDPTELEVFVSQGYYRGVTRNI